MFSGRSGWYVVDEDFTLDERMMVRDMVTFLYRAEECPELE